MSEHHNISLPEVIDSSDKLTSSTETTTSNIDVSPSAIKGYKILANKIEKSDTDDRSYRMIELDNGLKAMLIHDPETDHGSAALDVHVGHLSDPENLQGLAHFCEHLLFMGTEKYPVENDYNQYLSEHGGDSNAFTSLDNTNYFFEVRHEHFEGALDRFAQFFISPLFSPSCTEREIKAVDSENKKNLQSDNWRIFQLEKSLSNPKHPYCHFGTGNLQTLWDGPIEQGLDVRAELLKFHAKYYSSNIMKLVVLGRESLDKLTDWVVNKFSPIQNKSIAVPEFPGSPLTPLELQKQVKIRPVKDIRTLELAFPFPDQYPMYKVQPGRYLSHLIGHEGAGSILSLLKKKGWANYLSAGASHGGIGFEFFKISVDLTEEGLNHTDEIVRIVFQYIEMMKRVGVQEWIFREVENLASMSFRFKEKTPPSSYTSRVATLMQRPYPAEWVLSGPYLIRDYDPKCIEECLAWLRPDNFRIFLISQSFDPKEMETEKWYGTNYQVMEFSEGFKEELRKLTLNSELKFPKPNPFIPTDFDTHKVPGKEILKRPALICNNGTSRVWHKKDDTFWVPKVNMWFFFRTPLAYDTPSSCVKTRMFTELLRDSLTEYSYDAEVAGINYSLENETEGISLEIDGYNDKIGILLEAIVQRMKAFEIKEERFEIVREEVRRGFKNFQLEAPHQHAMYYLSYVIQDRLWTHEEKLEELEELTFEDVKNFVPQLLRHLHIESLIHGNISQDQAKKLAQSVEAILKPKPLLQSQLISSRESVIIDGANYVHQRSVPNKANVNSAIEYYCQVGSTKDTSLRARLNLLAKITQEPCFDQLRTKEQLGYLVFSGMRNHTTTMGLRIILQSEKEPIYLENRIEVFLEKLQTIIENMAEPEYQKHVDSLIAKKLAKNKNLWQESHRYWAHIHSGFYEFGQIDTDVQNLRNIPKSDLLKFYNEYVHPTSTHRKKVSIHLKAEKTPTDTASTDLNQDGRDHSKLADNNEIVSDLVLFKSSLPLSKAAVPMCELPALE